MPGFKQFLNLFGHKDTSATSERFLIYETVEYFNKNDAPAYQDVLDGLSNVIPNRDKILITLTNSFKNTYSFNNSTLNSDIAQYSAFILESDSDDPIQVNIGITKDYSGGVITVYESQKFFEDIYSKDLLDVMSFFSKVLMGKNHVQFECQDDCELITMKSIVIGSSHLNVFNEYCRIDKLKETIPVTNFLNASKYELLPDDFEIILSSNDQKVVNLFNRIRFVLSLCLISNTAIIKDNILEFQVNGFRNNTYNLDVNRFEYQDNYSEFYKIYKWIFSGGNFADKLTLSRQLIGIHCKYSSVFDIDGRTFSSILSNYELYLKQNVTQYIELKNKLTEFIIASTNEIDNITISFFDRLKNNFIAFFTFFIGVILTNVVSDNRLTDVFTTDVVKISNMILMCSFLFLIISIVEVVYRFSRYKKIYLNLKASYRDILDENDIDNIYQNDKLLMESKTDVVKNTWLISIIWAVAIVVVFVIINNINFCDLFSRT